MIRTTRTRKASTCTRTGSTRTGHGALIRTLGTARARSRRLPALLAGALLACLGTSSAHALKPVERHQWMAFVGVGTGHAEVQFNETAAEPGWTRGAAATYGLGRMFGTRLMLSAGNRQWLDEGGLADYKLRANIQNWNLWVTVFPGKATNWTSGIYVQGGAGHAHARLSALEPIPGGPDMYGNTYEEVAIEDENGFGWSVALGYEFRISSHLAAGVGMSYNYLDFDDRIFDTAKFYPGGVTLSWYF